MHFSCLISLKIYNVEWDFGWEVLCLLLIVLILLLVFVYRFAPILMPKYIVLRDWDFVHLFFFYPKSIHHKSNSLSIASEAVGRCFHPQRVPRIALPSARPPSWSLKFSMPLTVFKLRRSHHFLCFIRSTQGFLIFWVSTSAVQNQCHALWMSLDVRTWRILWFCVNGVSSFHTSYTVRQLLCADSLSFVATRDEKQGCGVRNEGRLSSSCRCWSEYSVCFHLTFQSAVHIVTSVCCSPFQPWSARAHQEKFPSESKVYTLTVLTIILPDRDYSQSLLTFQISVCMIARKHRCARWSFWCIRNERILTSNISDACTSSWNCWERANTREAFSASLYHCLWAGMQHRWAAWYLCTGCAGGSRVAGKQGWGTMAKLQRFACWVMVVMSNWTWKGGIYAFVSFCACANKTLGDTAEDSQAACCC